MNDSTKSIEAYVAHRTCHSHIVPSDWADTLIGAWNAIQPDGTFILKKSGEAVKPREGRLMNLLAVPGISDEGTPCENHIDAIIFADGSYEGPEALVRALNARRDAFSARLSFWQDRINRKTADKPSLKHIREDAMHIVDEDKEALDYMQQHHLQDLHLKPWYEFWTGKLWADEQFVRLVPSDSHEENAAEELYKIRNSLTESEKKFDGDLATKRLDAIFPPLSATATLEDIIADDIRSRISRTQNKIGSAAALVDSHQNLVNRESRSSAPAALHARPAAAATRAPCDSDGADPQHPRQTQR